MQNCDDIYKQIDDILNETIDRRDQAEADGETPLAQEYQKIAERLCDILLPKIEADCREELDQREREAQEAFSLDHQSD